MMEAFEEMMRRGGTAATATATRFFMKDDPVHRTLIAITSKLAELEIPYAVVGGMALVAHGYDRTTEDVDILVNRAGLDAIIENLEGLGYVRPAGTSAKLRDTRTGVRIEFLITGGFPGDGKPKPVAFPDPADVRMKVGDIEYINLPALFNLKLASGMTAAHRLKDLADAQEILRALNLPRDFAEQLNAYVRPKFLELWDAVANDPARDET